MMKEPVILNHCFPVQYGVERRFDLVFEGKAVPPNFAGAILQHPSVQATEDVWRVVLCIGGANGGFEVGSEVVAVQACRGFR